MKNKMTNKILFTFLCMFMLVGIVEGTIGTGAGQTGGWGTTPGSGSSLTARPYSGENYAIGIRISFFTVEGIQLSSTDYLNSNVITSNIHTQYGSGQPCSKVSSCPYSDSWQVTESFQTTASLSNIFYKNGFSVNIDSILSGGSLSKKVLFSSLLNTKSIVKAKQLFTDLGVDPDSKYDSNNASYNLFLVWEPLGFVTYEGQYYVGTSYELSTFASRINGSFTFGSRTVTGDGFSAALGGALTLNMGCAVNLEPESDTKFGQSVASKFGNTYFDSTKYFGGKLDPSTASDVQSKCHGTSYGVLKPYVVDNTTSALGVGILWFDEIINNNGISCDDVWTFYSDGKTYIDGQITSTGTFDFSAFNAYAISKKLKFPTGLSAITVDWYKTNCYDQKPTGYDCTPEYNVPSCTEGDNKTLVYKDSSKADGTNDSYWQNCVFNTTNDLDGYKIKPHKTSANNTPTTYREDSLGSKYCEVYCIEETYANFDSNNPTVLAGSHFVWGWSTINSSRTCKTKSIDYKQFEIDLTNANQYVVDAYAAELLDSIISGEDKWDGPYDVDGDPYCHGTEYIDRNGETQCTGSIYGDHINDRYEWAGTDSISVTASGYTGHAVAADTTAIVDIGASPSGKPHAVIEIKDSNGNVVNTTDKFSSSDAIKNVGTVIKNMENCYTWNESNIYNDASTATITYVSDVYNYSAEMDRYREYTISVAIDNKCEKDTKVAFNKCDNGTCSGSATMDKCYKYEATRGANISFGLKSGVFDIVLKNPNGLTLKSIHSSELNNYTSNDKFTINYLNIGYSNFPVPYYLSNGTYQGTLNITYSNLGHKRSADTPTAIDAILSQVNNSQFVFGNYGDWSCGYTVTGSKTGCIIDCDEKPGDINVIYREIDLYYPFPDIDADAKHNYRKTGANWCDRYDCAWNNAVSRQYILENRNVTGDDLYDLEPMYTFIMTPSDIIQIRRYNDENTYTSYTGSYAGKTYDFKCITGTGRGCRSEYLTELMTMMDTTNYVGSCKTEREVYPTISQFESCRYKGTNQ